MQINALSFFMVGFEGKSPPPHLQKWLQKGLKGVIYFSPNIASASQLGNLSRELKALGHKGLLIGIDQEGGRVARLCPPEFEALPPALSIAPDQVEKGAKRLALMLKSCGINLDFAPVLDIHTNPANPIIGNRAFGCTADEVVQKTLPFIRTLQACGVLACGKHFPGHGDTGEDSHLILPVVKKSVAELEACELVPFRSAINDLYLIMTAHVLYPSLDAFHPATFSKKILTDLLKNQWGYRGAVISDDMAMEGAKKNTDLPQACVDAFAAGCDLLLICREFDRHEDVIIHFEKALAKSGTLKKRAEDAASRLQNIPQF